MKITRVNLWKVALTSHETYYMADGKACDTVDTVVVCLETDTGLKGWGEVCPIPHYLPAYADGVMPAIQEMAPVLLGADPVGPEALMRRLDAWLPGHFYAKSAVDTALWDLTAKAADLPLYRLLGGKLNDALPLYHSITCVAPDEMVRIAQNAYQQGMRQFQVKLGADSNWEADVARLRKVREAVGNGPLVYGDWNCGSNKLDAIRVGRAVADLDLMLEQPCKTLEECASVKRACGLPMKIDENAFDLASLLEAHRLDCLDAVAVKLSKFGGLSAMRRARDLCVHLGAKMCVEDTWGSDISTATAIHLATATPRESVMNVCDLSGYVAPRLDAGGPVRDHGKIRPGETPGHGIEPDPGVLGESLLDLA
ncbi:MAG: mandelate racemase/muconate lactonizing enzyme family protein [Pseudomonadota bacterium]